MKVIEFTDREVHFLHLILKGLVEEPWVTIIKKLGEDTWKKNN